MYSIENEQGGKVRGRMLEKMGYSREGPQRLKKKYKAVVRI